MAKKIKVVPFVTNERFVTHAFKLHIHEGITLIIKVLKCTEDVSLVRTFFDQEERHSVFTTTNTAIGEIVQDSMDEKRFSSTVENFLVVKNKTTLSLREYCETVYQMTVEQGNTLYTHQLPAC